jgi:hypothetical protein
MATYIIVKYWRRPLLVIINEPIQAGMMDIQSAYDMHGYFTGMLKRKHLYLHHIKTGKEICQIPIEHSYVEILRDDDFPKNLTGTIKQKRNAIRNYVTQKFGDIFLHPENITNMPGKICFQKYPHFIFCCLNLNKYHDIAYADRIHIS